MNDQKFIKQFTTMAGAMELLETKWSNTIEQYVTSGVLNCLRVDNAEGKRQVRLFYKVELRALKKAINQKRKVKG